MRKELPEQELELKDAISKGALMRRARKTIDSILIPIMNAAKSDKEEKALEVIQTTRNFYLTNLETAIDDESTIDTLECLPDMASALKTIEISTYRMMQTSNPDEKNYRIQIYNVVMDKKLRAQVYKEKNISAYIRLIRTLIKKTGKVKRQEYKESVRNLFGNLTQYKHT